MSDKSTTIEHLAELGYAAWCDTSGGHWMSWEALVTSRPEFAARWRAAAEVIAVRVAAAFAPAGPNVATSAVAHGELMRAMGRRGPAVDDLSANQSSE